MAAKSMHYDLGVFSAATAARCSNSSRTRSFIESDFFIAPRGKQHSKFNIN